MKVRVCLRAKQSPMLLIFLNCAIPLKKANIKNEAPVHAINSCMNHACINGIRLIMSLKDSHKSEMADTTIIRLATLGIIWGLSPILSYLVMIRGICCCALSTTGYEAYHYGVSIFAYMYVMFLGN